jgi:hypothetical protein
MLVGVAAIGIGDARGKLRRECADTTGEVPGALRAAARVFASAPDVGAATLGVSCTAPASIERARVRGDS